MLAKEDPRDNMAEIIARQPRGSRLRAKDHIARLEAFFQHLRQTAECSKKTVLIKELRELRSETSWLIGQLEKGKVKC